MPKKSEHFFTQIEFIPKGYGYNQFSKKHFMLLFITFVFSMIIAYLYKLSNNETRAIIRLCIALTLISMEIIKLIGIGYSSGMVLEYIPLEICSFAGYCISLDTFMNTNGFIRVMLLTLFLPAAILALTFPTTISLPVKNFFTIHQFLFHGLIIAYVTSRFIVGEITLSYLGVIKSIISVFLLSIFMYIIDSTFDKNYMFLRSDGGSALLKKIYNLSGGGHKYRACLVLVSIIIIHIFYVIFKLIDVLFIH